MCVCVCLCVFVLYCNTPENELTGEARAASNHESQSSHEHTAAAEEDDERLAVLKHKQELAASRYETVTRPGKSHGGEIGGESKPCATRLPKPHIQ